jgi:prepilin-type N-terminal cleavage/methylation domain-containing protein
MRSKLNSPRQNGFTLIELLVTIAIIAILITFLPAVQRVRQEARHFESRPHLAALGADLRSFADAATKIQSDAAALALAAANSGEEGALDANGLQTLCGDLLDADNTASFLLRDIGARLGDTRVAPNASRDQDDEHKRDRARLLRAQAAVTESQSNLKQLEGTLSKVYACGPGAIVTNAPPESRAGQRANH